MAPVHFADAHIDWPGQGGWGSSQQLEGLRILRGAVRVFFCEPQDVDGSRAFHTNWRVHLAEICKLRDAAATHARANSIAIATTWCVEGFESVHTTAEAKEFLDILSRDFGVTAVIPIYHPGNPLGGCSKESGVGLTALGTEVIRMMFAMDIAVDFAHMSHKSMRDVLVLADIWAREHEGEYPRICYSHGGIAHNQLTDPLIMDGNSERCINPKLAQEIINRKGIVCLSGSRPFYPDLALFIEHVESLVHENSDNHLHVGIGMDYGGILDEWRFDGCTTIAEAHQTIAQALINQLGTEEADVIRQICGTNVLRFYRIETD
jgi:microsomal dipeptidase-like Zn-dependent dipeptidase